MIGVIFELETNEGKTQEYLELAKALRTDLEKIEGFISIERFQSLTDPKKLLSLSFWETEEAIEKWRNLESHRMAQYQGRDHILADYRLRVVSVLRDYGLNDRDEAPQDSWHYHQ